MTNNFSLISKNQYHRVISHLFFLLLTLNLPNYGHAFTEAEKIIENNCRSCHGVEGKAKVESWPNLVCQNRGYLYDRMLAFRHNNEHDIDKTIKSLSLSQIDEISRYYAELKCPLSIKR